jgi:hypothetical protein
VKPLASRHAGDDLHRSIPPRADLDPAHVAAPRRKPRGIPAEQALVTQFLSVILGRIEHLFDDAIDITAGAAEGANRAGLTGGSNS